MGGNDGHGDLGVLIGRGKRAEIRRESNECIFCR